MSRRLLEQEPPRIPECGCPGEVAAVRNFSPAQRILPACVDRHKEACGASGPGHQEHSLGSLDGPIWFWLLANHAFLKDAICPQFLLSFLKMTAAELGLVWGGVEITRYGTGLCFRRRRLLPIPIILRLCFSEKSKGPFFFSPRKSESWSVACSL